MGERGREMGENDNDGVCEVASQRKKIRERDDTWVTSCLFDAPHLVVTPRDAAHRTATQPEAAARVIPRGD
jgi:hypothetical protein